MCHWLTETSVTQFCCQQAKAECMHKPLPGRLLSCRRSGVRVSNSNKIRFFVKPSVGISRTLNPKPTAPLTPLLPIVQDGKLLSWGRPTYGGLGRAAVDVASDAALPAPARVDGLDDVHVAAAAGGAFLDARLVNPCTTFPSAGARDGPRARRRGAWRCALMNKSHHPRCAWTATTACVMVKSRRPTARQLTTLDIG